MEKANLNEFLNSFDKAKLGSKKNEIQPWYNEFGDCIEFQTRHEAIVADRIDDYLTIYRSAVNNDPIGFQLKDVRALLRKYKLQWMQCSAKVDKSVLIRLDILLMYAFKDSADTVSSGDEYLKLIKSVSSESSEIKVPIPA